MRTCLAWPICLDDGRSWLAGELPDHELLLSSPGPVLFVYSLADGQAGWKALAAVLGRVEAKYGTMERILCRSSVPGLLALFPRLDPDPERIEDRWLFKADRLRVRLHAINSRS